MHVEQLPCTACLPNLVLIVEVNFLYERGNADRQTHVKSQVQLIITIPARLGEKLSNPVLYFTSQSE